MGVCRIRRRSWDRVGRTDVIAELGRVLEEHDSHPVDVLDLRFSSAQRATDGEIELLLELQSALAGLCEQRFSAT